MECLGSLHTFKAARCRFITTNPSWFPVIDTNVALGDSLVEVLLCFLRLLCYWQATTQRASLLSSMFLATGAVSVWFWDWCRAMIAMIALHVVNTSVRTLDWNTATLALLATPSPVEQFWQFRQTLKGPGARFQNFGIAYAYPYASPTMILMILL